MSLAPPLAAFALALLLTASFAPNPATARTIGRLAYVVDARLAALRAAPDLSASILRRLRAGRRLVVVGAKRDRDGARWIRVAVTRRTRGWLLEESTATPGDAAGEARLAARLAALRGLPRIEIARLAVDRFARLRAAAAEALDEEAAAAAEELSSRVAKRLAASGSPDATDLDRRRRLMLSDPALDRYNRLGVTFDVDPTRGRYTPRKRLR